MKRTADYQATADSRDPIVLKIGGSITDSPPLLQHIARQLRKWQETGTPLLLVHGGGAAISRLQGRFHIQPHFQDGIRITEKEEMPLVDMALCGAVNKALVRLLRLEGLNSWGISGCDAGMVQAVRPPGVTPNQHTGTVGTVNIQPIRTMWGAGYLPVLAPPATDERGLAMNVNADETALSLAMALGAGALVFLSDVEGVLDGGVPVPFLDPENAQRMMEDGRIGGGMIPKVRSCLRALERGVGSVHIGSCGLSDSLDDLLSARRGTVICREIPRSAERDEAPDTAMENRAAPDKSAGRDENPDKATESHKTSAWEDELPFPPQYGERLMVMSRGEGCYLYDRSGREYLDMASGIAVNSLGYGREDLTLAARVQMERLVHVSNLFATEPQLELARAILRSARLLGDFRSLHFGNSGTEANEAAIKYARLYARRKKGLRRSRLIAFSRGFHGRTLGSLSLTANESYREPFGALLPDVEFLPFNDVGALGALGEDVAAVIVEPVQGEGGLRRVEEGFARELNGLCRRHGVVLIADEVQTGVGRCGELFASGCVGLEPDVITLAKPLAGGLPLSATVLGAAVHDVVRMGDHGSTFGGGPVTASVGLRVWELLSEPGRLAECRRKGELLGGLLGGVLDGLGLPGEVLGLGMLRGLRIDLPECDSGWCRDLIAAVREAGVLVLRSGLNVIRFAPPLLMEDNLLREGVERFCGVLGRITG